MNPSTQTVSINKTFTIEVYCVPSEPIKGYELEIAFDKSLVQAVSVTNGDIFDSFPNSFNTGTIDNSAGLITSIYGFIIGPYNTSNPGILCNITFSSKTYGGTTPLKFNRVGQWTGVVNETGYLPITVADGSVTIQGPEGPSGSPGSPGSSPPLTPPPVEEENHPPETPMKPSGPTFIELGVEYLFETSTFDVDDDEIRIKFDWGDGNFSDWSEFFSSNSSIGNFHVWNNVSTFSVKALAQDENGLNSSWSSPLNIIVSQFDNGTTPIPSIIVIYDSNTTNDTITFDASETFDPEGIIVSYHWDFGDGNFGTGKTCSHKYQHPGEYIVALTVTDDKGYNYSKIKTITVFGAEETTTEQESNEGLNLIFLLTGLIIGIFIIVLIIIFIFLRKNIKEFAFSHHIHKFSDFLKERNQRRINKIDYQLNKISKKMDRLAVPHKHARIKMENSIDESLPRYTSTDTTQDIEMTTDKLDNYKSDTYDYHTGEKYDRFLSDPLKSDYFKVKSFEKTKEKEEDEEDIDKKVDRLLLSKMLEKNSMNSDKDSEKNQ
jgi:hypothetical protein